MHANLSVPGCPNEGAAGQSLHTIGENMQVSKISLAIALALTPAAIASYDCLVLATDHDGFDYPQLLLHAPLMVDTRGRLGVGLANVVAA